MPLFFKLWFFFVALMVISIFSVSGYIGYKVATDPAVIGRTAAEVVNGYKSTAK